MSGLPLASEFPPVSEDEWHERVSRVLKGATADERLLLDVILVGWLSVTVVQGLRLGRCRLDGYLDARDVSGLVGVGGHGELQGLAYHWEMWGFAQGGMSPLEALRTATIAPARKLV